MSVSSHREGPAGPEQSQDVSELRPVFGISPRSSSPSRPSALQHDEYKNWWVIDKTGPVEDRGFILHINYRAIFHYSQPLSHSDNTGLVELFLSSDNTLVFTIGRYLRKQSTGEPLPIAKKLWRVDNAMIFNEKSLFDSRVIPFAVVDCLSIT